VQALALRSEELTVEGGLIRLTTFSGSRSEVQEAAWDDARRTLEQLGLEQAPRAGDLGLDRELLQALIRGEELVAVGEFVYLPDQIATILGHIRSFREPFTVSEFKDRAGISRKYAIPLMEWADAQGHTVRMGDRRRVRDRS
jgi:selenocysteine-specific elongation factor